MKKTPIYTIIAALGTFAYNTAGADLVSYTYKMSPLNSTDGWVLGMAKGGSNKPAIAGGAITPNNCSWSQVYGSYALTSTPVTFTNNGVDKLDFSFDINYGSSLNVAVMVTFIGTAANGDTVAVSMGHGSYENTQPRRSEMGITVNPGNMNFFQTQGSSTNGTFVSSTQNKTGMFELNTTTKISGSFTLNDNGEVVFSCNAGGSATTLALTSIDSVHIGLDGASGVAPSVSNLSLSYTTLVPEPATATLSLLALAGLCARRRRK